MPTLFEISEDISALDALLEESEGEITSEIDAWMTENGENLCRKSDGIAHYVKEQEYRADACKQEAAKLAAKGKACENRIASLKTLVDCVMQRLGVAKLQGATYSVSRQRNGGARKLTVLCPTEALPPEYRTDVTVTRANTDALRAELDLHAGSPCVASTYARLEDASYSIRIR